MTLVYDAATYPKLVENALTTSETFRITAYTVVFVLIEDAFC